MQGTRMLLLLAFGCLLGAGFARAGDAAKAPLVVDVRSAYRYALEHNPELAPARQQRPIAEAGVLQARTYPFNPYLTVTPRGASGTEFNGILQHAPIASSVTLEVEVRGQKAKRLDAAHAGLARTEWEIAAQEYGVTLRTVRAFNTVIYRQDKLKLAEEAVQLAQKAIKDVQEVWKKKNEKVPAGELVLAQFEVSEARAQQIGARGPLVAARQELLRVMGTLQEVTLQGTLEITYRDFREAELVTTALSARADLQARRLAVTEAEARLKLERANRFGNPTIGPNYEYNESKASFIGISIGLPVPLLNRKKAEIQQRDAELTKAALELHQVELQTRQDVKAVLARLAEVQDLIRLYRKDYVPTLQARTHELEDLYSKGKEGVDLQQVLELRRRSLKARDSLLDAMYDHGQLEVEIAAAVGDIELALDP